MIQAKIIKPKAINIFTEGVYEEGGQFATQIGVEDYYTRKYKAQGTPSWDFVQEAMSSTAKGMAEQRIPNMRGIMAARTKPLTVIPAEAVEDLTSYATYSMPNAKSSVKMIDPSNMDELVALLHNEAKVI